MVAKKSGEPSLARIELFTQNAYFVFQVVQVFLVVTVAASASSLIKQLSDNPTGITSLLATRLPTASNFYISYFIIQGLSISAGVLSQVVGFVIFKLLYKYLSGTPRSLYTKWANLSAISWGSTLPVFTNIAVIGMMLLSIVPDGLANVCKGIVYSCIAPLVLGFATIGMSLFYLAYRYNILFVTDSKIDTKGLIYPRALQQLLTGVYLGELCMIGLFAINVSTGPLVLMIAFLIFTILFHLSLNSALDPLLYTLPRSLEAEEESLRFAAAEALATPDRESKENEKNEKVTTALAAPHKKPNFISKFLAPHIYADYETLRRLVPLTSADLDNMYEDSVAKNAYFPPAVTAEVPLLWIPRDEAGISRQEVAHTSKIIPITDEGCTLNEKNKLEWDAEGARPPLWTPKISY